MLVHPGRLFIEQYGPVEGPEDVVRYAAFLRDEAGIDAEPPVDIGVILKKFGMPTPKRVPLAGQQGVLWDSEAGLILIEERDRPTRQRFSEAHELMEMLFAAMPTRSHAYGRDVGNFKYLTKERLCNAGAAELLTPATTFLPRVHQLGVSLKPHGRWPLNMRSLWLHLIRMATSNGRHAVVLYNEECQARSSVKCLKINRCLPLPQIARQNCGRVVLWDKRLFIPQINCI